MAASSSSSSSKRSKRMVVLKTEDDKEFRVEESVVKLSQTLKNFLLDSNDEVYKHTDTTIPLMNVNSDVMSKVLEYSEKHSSFKIKKSNVDQQEQMKQWDENFINSLETRELLGLIMAANYLSIKDLLELCAQRAADLMKGKQPEEIRTTFNIKNDFAPEKEEEIKNKHPWAFE